MQSNKMDVLANVSEQMLAVIQKSEELAGDAFDTNQSLDELRASYVKERAFWNQGGPQMDRIVDTEIPAYDGNIVPTRLYYPAGVTFPVPAIIYIHGGGWILGSPDTHDRITRILADNTCTDQQIPISGFQDDASEQIVDFGLEHSDLYGKQRHQYDQDQIAAGNALIHIGQKIADAQLFHWKRLIKTHSVAGKQVGVLFFDTSFLACGRILKVVPGQFSRYQRY